MAGGVLPFSNRASWSAHERSYRGAEGASDQMLAVVHDGAELLVNTSGRPDESKTFQRNATYDLYVPYAAEPVFAGAPALADRLLENSYARETIGIDRVKDPDALRDVIVASLEPFRSFSDLQVSARVGSAYWDNMVPLRDFVLAHNLTEAGEYVRRQTPLGPIQQRALPETVLPEDARPPSYRGGAPPRGCLLQ